MDEPVGVADGSSARSGIQLDANFAWTVILNVVLLFVLPACLIYGTFGLGACDGGRSCNSGRVVAGSVVLVAGLIGIFVLAIGLSVLLLLRRRFSFYLPILAAIAMLGCVEIAFKIAWYET